MKDSASCHAAPTATQWHLQILTPVQFLRRPAAFSRHTFQPRRPIGFNKNQRVAPLSQARFHQLRGIQNNSRNVSSDFKVSHDLGTAFLQPGVEQTFQPGQLGRVRENDLRDRPPIHLAGRLNHPVPPPLSQSGQHRFGGQLGMGQPIKIDHGGPQRFENPRDRGLAGADATDQPDDRFAIRWVETRQKAVEPSAKKRRASATAASAPANCLDPSGFTDARTPPVTGTLRSFGG
jgi:hypothetical protein